MSNFYTYIYLDPRKQGKYKYKLSENTEIIFNNEPFYVGKGKSKRDKHHLYLRNSNKTHNKYLTSKINKIIKESNQEPIIIRVKDNLTELESFGLEKTLIKVIGRKDLNQGTLVNHTDGGEGETGKIITELARTHSGTFKKGQTPWNKNKKGTYHVHTEESKNKIRYCNLGLKRSEEQCLNIAISRGSKPVLQYDVNGNLIREWSYIGEIRRAGFKTVPIILARGTNYANGYLWYKKIDNNFPLKVNKYNRKIHNYGK